MTACWRGRSPEKTFRRGAPCETRTRASARLSPKPLDLSFGPNPVSNNSSALHRDPETTRRTAGNRSPVPLTSDIRHGTPDDSACGSMDGMTSAVRSSWTDDGMARGPTFEGRCRADQPCAGGGGLAALGRDALAMAPEGSQCFPISIGAAKSIGVAISASVGRIWSTKAYSSSNPTNHAANLTAWPSCRLFRAVPDARGDAAAETAGSAQLSLSSRLAAKAIPNPPPSFSKRLRKTRVKLNYSLQINADFDTFQLMDRIPEPESAIG